MALLDSLLFTFSSNILHTYILPVMVPIALLITHWWPTYKRKTMMLKTGLVFPSLVVILAMVFFFSGYNRYYLNTDKYLIEAYKTEITNKKIPLYYWKSKSYSGQFYSSGKAKLIANREKLTSIFEDKKEFLLVISKREKDIIASLDQFYKLIDENYKTNIYIRIVDYF